MKNIAILVALLISVNSEQLIASELLIWRSNRDAADTNMIIHVLQTKDNGVTCTKICPTGQSQQSIEKLGAIILNSDQRLVAVGPVGLNLVPPLGLNGVVDVASSYNHAIALTCDGTIEVWGDGFFSTNNVPSGLSNAVGVAAGAGCCVAVRSNGTLTLWSSGGTDRHWKGASQVTAISLSQGFFNGHGMALKQDGTVLQWHRQTMASPVDGISNIVAIAVSPAHGLGLTREGKVVAWKSNGSQTSVPAGVTNIVAIAAGYEYVAAEAASGFSLALRNNGTIFGWRQMGKMESNIVPLGISNVVAIAAGDGFCMALTTNCAVAERFMK